MKGIFFVLLFLAGIGCSNEKPVEDVAVEFRFAERAEAEGLTVNSMEGTGEHFYLHPQVVFSNKDIARASQTEWEGKYAVEIICSDAGREKLAALTGENVGRRVGMLLNGRLIVAPRINAAIPGGRAVINGSFSKDEARRIAKGINNSIKKEN